MAVQSAIAGVVFPLPQQWQGWALCALLSCAYVGSLYMVPARIRVLRRDNPKQVLLLSYAALQKFALQMLQCWTVRKQQQYIGRQNSSSSSSCKTHLHFSV